MAARRRSDEDPLAQLERAGKLPLERVVTLQLNRLSTAFERQWTSLLRARAGISLAEWRVLTVLNDRGDVTPAEAARIISMHKGLCGRACAALVRRGLIDRAEDERDSRATRIALTQEGRLLLARLMPVSMDRQRHVLEALDAEERRAFYSALAKIDAAIGRWKPPPAR